MEKARLGFHILRRKNNSFTILDKDMQKVKGPFKSIETCEMTRGCAYFNLDPKWLPCKH